jgi:hypothetical protein
MPRERPLTAADPTDHPTHPQTAKAQNRGIRVTGTHTFTHRQFNEIVHGVDHWFGEYPNPQHWRGLVVAI